jgi:CheY-like chemotaxis protein
VPTPYSPAVEISPFDGDLQQLEAIEARLSVLLRQDKANWTEMAILALQVQSKKLYKQRGHRSFSQWLKQTAAAADKQPSLIWRFLKAAKYFLKSIGCNQLERVSEAKAPPEALEMLEKIERQAPPLVFLALKERVLAGQATVDECRQIEKDYRPAAQGRTNRGRPPKGQEGETDYLGKWKSNLAEIEAHNSQSQVAVLIENSQAQLTQIERITPQQMAASIKRSLRADCGWLTRCAEADSPPRNWGTHKEVRVFNSVARQDKRSLLRLGLVAAAQWDLDSKDLFVVEVKTHIAELQMHKWEEYLDFCNYFCFACPQGDNQLIEAIQETARRIPSAGILVADFSSLPRGQGLLYPCSIIKFPIRQKGKKASVVYETLYERVMGWSLANDSL